VKKLLRPIKGLLAFCWQFLETVAMRNALTLRQFAEEIERRKEAKRDFRADTRALKVTSRDNGKLVLEIFKDKKNLPRTVNHKWGYDSRIIVNDNTSITDRECLASFSMDDHFINQLATHYKIPRDYIKREARDNPRVVAGLANYYFLNSAKGSTKGEEWNRLVRTLDGKARAFLSSRYRVFDNEHVAEATLPAIADMGDNAQIVASEITDRRMYIQIRYPRLEGEVKKGDIVQGGLTISNSEDGRGSISIAPMTWRLLCTNGMIRGTNINRHHVGRHTGGSYEDSQEIFRDVTRDADDKALVMKIQDVVTHSVNEVAFQNEVRLLTEASESETIPARSIIPAVEVLSERVRLNEGEKNSVIQHLIEGGDMSKWGVANALTRTAQDVDPDRAYDLERAGSGIIDLPSKDWQVVTEAEPVAI
jgi:hypothetical protein